MITIAKKKVSEEARTYAIISYLTWVGLLVAFLMNMDKKHDFARFHIRQSLMIYLVGTLLWFIPVVGWFLEIVMIVFWILGFVSAVQWEKKEVPFIGKYAQDWFAGL